MNYIIDGYNLGYKIKSCIPLLKNGDTERAIPCILQSVAGRITAFDKKIIVVFDGRSGAFPRITSFSGIQVKFSKAPQKADDIIRNFLRKLKNPENWCSVSSDNEIIMTARAMGAQAEKSENFLSQQRKSSADRNRDSAEYKQKYQADNIDMNYWLKQFGAEDE